MPFLATGARVEFIEDPNEAIKIVQKLIDDGEAIIFFTDDLTDHLAPIIEEYRESSTPCLVSIPAGRGEVSKGTIRIREIIRRAVGVDILKEAE
jgi:vacuolar-type H+-ATPase subunit F/Vma7